MSKVRRGLEIHLPMALKWDKLELTHFGKQLVYTSPFLGKKIPQKEVIPFLKQGILGGVYLDNDTAQAHTHIFVTLEELEAFVKNAKKARTKFRKGDKKRGDKICSFWRHLSPEVSFFFTEKLK